MKLKDILKPDEAIVVWGRGKGRLYELIKHEKFDYMFATESAQHNFQFMDETLIAMTRDGVINDMEILKENNPEIKWVGISETVQRIKNIRDGIYCVHCNPYKPHPEYGVEEKWWFVNKVDRFSSSPIKINYCPFCGRELN